MDLHLQERTAIIMGGSRGLGLGIARSLAREGVRPCLLARDENRLRQAAHDLAADTGITPHWHAVDFSSPDSVQTCLTALQNIMPETDIIIGNGGGPPLEPATACDPALWQKETATMLLPVMQLVGQYLPGMRQRQFGRIIMVSSTSIVEPIPNLVLSSALRSALASWGKTLAREVAHDGVTVNTLLPGRFETDRVATLNRIRAEKAGIPLEEFRRQKENGVPAGRYGQPEELGHMAAFLASPLAAYITGTRIPVDGGLLHGF
ncbi:3-oxoacyl-ACP reductase [Parasaccharibacter sp. TMW2.1882]|uniref:SDR family oxidoreductase n=1 Tax=Parasaccharibacter sp. TMW2.1882 TaxID=2039286 RepID=UPI0020121DF1|nr:SDR family oxidoreductase [Parasaccharibacter sp. TMW2.1882]MCL1496418.1 3-oxoacyl-ACP reductase [Parasaccharibacter sp. TMW2.1882]